jgi:NADH:ubiquinone oxidoreductase subunit 3 (subunit A)
MLPGKILLALALIAGLSFPAAAGRDSLGLQSDYAQTYTDISNMLESGNINFKGAVFLVENAYYGGALSYEIFDRKIKFLASLAKAYQQTNHINYEGSDSAQVKNWAAIFKIMTDSIPVSFGDTIVYHPPFTYNFNDFDGSKDWPNMFVSTLLDTYKGNCHSMPYLYKMIAQECGSNAWLSLAPNHIYIKLLSKNTGWYNTELTSAEFPIDAWIMASGYVHLNAIQNGVYMDTIGDRQSLAMCLVDLAQGYEALKGPDADSFILKCCSTALKYYPDYINALLLQTKIYEGQFTRNMKAAGSSSIQEYTAQDAGAKVAFDRMTEAVRHIHSLGYRRMPTEMYLAWLSQLQTQKDKYTNKKITNFTK